MNNSQYVIAILISALLSVNNAAAQDNNNSCKVVSEVLAGTYTGDCKNGLANGKGEAKGFNRYTGNFKDGLPNGEGTYYYRDSLFHEGHFQDGLKEGKGVSHYLRPGLADSLVKGYWSGDVFRGSRYTTYSLHADGFFDRVEINPSSQSGNTLTIEISTTTGSPNGTQASVKQGGGYILTLSGIAPLDATFIRQTKSISTAFKSSTTFELSQFPSRLQVSLSDGKSFELELYKKANWMMKIYVNK